MKDMPWFAALGEMARSASAGYRVSYLVTLFVVLAAACIGLSTTVDGMLRWALFFLGLIVALASLVFSVVVTLKFPQLLRHENIELMHRTVDVMGDNELGSDARLDIKETIVRWLDSQPQSHKPPRIKNSPGDNSDG